MIWRLFRRTTEPDRWTEWWREAERVAGSPSIDAIDLLAQALTGTLPDDDVEPQEEMVLGLRALLELSAAERLPVLASQHRVVGTDICHFIAPVTLRDASPGKLFLTSKRLVLVAGAVTSRPWHGVGRLARAGRRLTIGSGEQAIDVQCNSFGDALAACHLASRLSPGSRRP